ncbi:MAG: alpha-ketoglutarate-dependent dioxygenase AlkB [Actinomycetota bacterium]|nr:alpha-ketoglutarate-dependent dioxygenase AlkB [Actinomycetota bacterium]
MVALQGSLLSAGELAVDRSVVSERIVLGDGAWAELAEGWLTGADMLFGSLASDVPWRQGRRWMYERMVDEPRLSRWYRAGSRLPHPMLDELRRELGRRYGKGFASVGLNYYRDGRDSVAFHRDRELRYLDDTLVCIVTLGAARPFVLRPLGGGSWRKLLPGSGDLLVMGGSCQSSWEHAVPKVAGSGPRISASFRWTSGKGPVTSPSSGRYRPRS